MTTYSRRGVLAAGAALAAGASATWVERALGARPPAPLGTTLRYYSWFDYVSPETTAAFTRATGVRVNWAYFASNEALWTRLAGGARGYDLANPTGYMVAALAEAGLLRRIDWRRLPQARKNLDRRFLSLPHDPKNAWSVPKDWGTTGFVYRTDLVRERPTTWKQFFGLFKRYPKKLALLDGSAEVIGSIALMLGYSFNTERNSELAQVRSFLLALKPLVHSVDSRRYATTIARGRAYGGLAWNGDGAYVIAKSPRNAADYVVPREGAELWVDAHVIPKGAANPAAAHAWIDFVCRPRIAALETVYTYFGSPLKRSTLEGAVPKSILRNRDVFPPESTLRRLEPSNLSEEGARKRERIWREFKQS